MLSMGGWFDQALLLAGSFGREGSVLSHCCLCLSEKNGR